MLVLLQINTSELFSDPMMLHLQRAKSCQSSKFNGAAELLERKILGYSQSSNSVLKIGGSSFE